MVEELFSSYERDFLQHIALLQTAVDEKQDAHSQLDTAYHTCQMLMKQMEVEVVNHDDQTMRKVSPALLICAAATTQGQFRQSPQEGAPTPAGNR